MTKKYDFVRYLLPCLLAYQQMYVRVSHRIIHLQYTRQGMNMRIHLCCKVCVKSE